MESVSPYQRSPVLLPHDQKVKSNKLLPTSEPLDFMKVTKDVVLKRLRINKPFIDRESSAKGMLLLQRLSVPVVHSSTSTSIKRQDRTVL